MFFVHEVTVLGYGVYGIFYDSGVMRHLMVSCNNRDNAELIVSILNADHSKKPCKIEKSENDIMHK